MIAHYQLESQKFKERALEELRMEATERMLAQDALQSAWLQVCQRIEELKHI